MNNAFPYTIYACGDHAVTVDFGKNITGDINTHVLQLFNVLEQKNIPGIKDVIPAYSSLTLVYDVVAVRANNSSAFQWASQQLEDALNQKTGGLTGTGRLIKIPACYETQYAPDLAQMALQKNISPAAIIQQHCYKTYRVYMLGFLPGFAYMGTVDESISMRRRATPRTSIAAGSIGIAGSQTGIYPMESPGGWNIIARTPIKLFDAQRDEPALLQPGDEVQFYPITAEEFDKIKSAI